MNDTLLELFQIGGRKNYQFHFKMVEEKENHLELDVDNKLIKVSIGDPENKELTNRIEELIEKLK